MYAAIHVPGGKTGNGLGRLQPGRLPLSAILPTAVAFMLAIAVTVGSAHAEADGAAVDRAEALWRQGYLLHTQGAYEHAVKLFERSIEVSPTAEGHTFLGWSLSHLGLHEEAIVECKRAIALDPDFGNPYNDIGVYLIELDRLDEAISWLEKAILASRYCCYQYPYFNLGRIYLKEGKLDQAKRQFEQTLEQDPNYLPAKLGLKHIRDHWL